jgi:diadenosine tetraphosphate (Ap4A) HIT family hydrolase
VQSFDQYLVYENAHYRAEQSSDCSIPGYLILSAKEPVGSITGLTVAALEGLGPTLAVLIDAIETVVRPELVYFARFGEEVKRLHCHLFPRTASLAAEFLASAPDGGKLNGPLLLNWARSRYSSVTVSATQRESVMEATRAIREHLRAASPVSLRR